jgi:hypothetical protein
MANSVNIALGSIYMEVTAFYLLHIELNTLFEESIENQVVNNRKTITKTEEQKIETTKGQITNLQTLADSQVAIKTSTAETESAVLIQT